MLAQRSPQIRKTVGVLKELSDEERARMLNESYEMARRDIESLVEAEREKWQIVVAELVAEKDSQIAEVVAEKDSRIAEVVAEQESRIVVGVLKELSDEERARMLNESYEMARRDIESLVEAEREKWQIVVAELDSQIAEKESRIAEQKKQIMIAELDSQIAENDSRIAELEAQLAKQKYN